MNSERVCPEQAQGTRGTKHAGGFDTARVFRGESRSLPAFCYWSCVAKAIKLCCWAATSSPMT